MLQHVLQATSLKELVLRALGPEALLELVRQRGARAAGPAALVRQIDHTHALLRGDADQLLLVPVNLLAGQWPHAQHHPHIFGQPRRHGRAPHSLSSSPCPFLLGNKKKFKNLKS